MIMGWLLTVVAVGEFFLGLWFLTRYQRSQGTFWFGLFSIAVSLYVGANAMGYLHWSWFSGQMAEHIAWTGGMLTGAFILPFSYTYPLPRKTWNELWPLAFWPAVIIVVGILFTNAFIDQQGIVRFGEGYTTSMGPYFYPMIIWFGLYWLWSFGIMSQSWRRSDGMHRRILSFTVFGLLVSFAIAAYFDVYIPLTEVTRFGYVGSLCTSVWLLITSYLLVRK